MSFLVRKIDKSKWMQNDIVKGEPVSADAITQCLQTRGNCLSVWRIPDESKLDDAVLAQATRFEYLESIDFVMLEEASVAGAGLSLERTPGDTAVKELVDCHLHVAALDYCSLGTFADLIADLIRAEKDIRYTKTDLVSVVASAVRTGRLEIVDLREKVRKRVALELRKWGDINLNSYKRD